MGMRCGVMIFKKGYHVGKDIAIELSKEENLALRRALNQCKKEDSATIQFNSGEWFYPHVLSEDEDV